MKRWQAIAIIFALCVACTDSNKQPQPSPVVPPVEPAKPENLVSDQIYNTEKTANSLKIYLDNQLLTEIKGGKVISESRHFVAYSDGEFIELMGKNGSNIYSCDSNCLVKVTNSFASVQTGPGEGVIFDANSERIYSSSTPEKMFYRISDTFASVSNSSSAVLFRVGNKAVINSCSNVACDILVSNGFAAVIEKNSATGSVIGSNGSTIYSFSVPGVVQLSNNFAAINHKDGAAIYHATKGRVFSASVPVRIKISDVGAIVFDEDGASFRYDQNGNSL